MNTYDIYGVGGALVDTEVQVSDEFLSKHDISKGVMTLVDECRQAELVRALKAKDIPILRKSGGSVCNSLVAASNLGSKTFFSGKVADDEDGDLYIEELSEAGVEFHKAGQEFGVTGKCLVMVTPDAERTMNTFLGASNDLTSREIDKPTLLKSKWFYIEGYLLSDKARAEAFTELVTYAKDHNVKIALSLSDPLIVRSFDSELRKLIGNGVNLIFCNRDEALAFTNESSLEDTFKELKKYTETFTITNGADGAITFDGKSVCYVPGIPANAVDTNGAGDMFAGAFLNSIILGNNYSDAALVANTCASRVVSKFGPRLSTKEFDEIKRSLGLKHDNKKN